VKLIKRRRNEIFEIKRVCVVVKDMGVSAKRSTAAPHKNSFVILEKKDERNLKFEYFLFFRHCLCMHE
jgi:hypothetical protein